MQQNGPKPWELLNEVMAKMAMPYSFNQPYSTEEYISFMPMLTDLHSGEVIRTEDLSSGEKTLLAIAMSFYSGTHLQSSITMPEAVLLDEPDASLHPSMIKQLLDMLNDVFVDGHHVKVIMTTHSPTTVALAPTASLYAMRREGSPRLTKVSRDEALASLLVGVPTLAVSNSNKRQVFVEAKDDEECYEELFTLLRPSLETPFVLTFIASGSGGKGNNHEVQELVAGLRARDLKIIGLIDRDAKTEAPDGIHFLATRYAIENLILDPVAVGVLMLRERIILAADVLGDDVPFFALTNHHAQTLCDHVMQETRKKIPAVQLPHIDSGDVSVLEYDQGATVTALSFAVNYRGHDWEALLLEAFPKLNRFKQNLKNEVIEKVFKDAPQWIPSDVRTLFDALLNA